MTTADTGPLAERLADPAWLTPLRSAGLDPATAVFVEMVGPVRVRPRGASIFSIINADSGILVIGASSIGIAVQESGSVVVMDDFLSSAQLMIGDDGTLKIIWQDGTDEPYGIIFNHVNVQRAEDKLFAETLSRWIN